MSKRCGSAVARVRLRADQRKMRSLRTRVCSLADLLGGLAVLVVALLVTSQAVADAPARPDRATVQARIDRLKVVDYFPSKSGWSLMWTRWDPATMDADFGRIADLGGNAVRIVVRADAFGFPDPSAAMLARLEQAIDLADRNGLRVEITLFDGVNPWNDVTGSERFAS